jgi:hypothetical protein
MINLVQDLEALCKSCEKNNDARTLNEAIEVLVKYGEKIVDLEKELFAAKREREYFRSRAAFFSEVAGEMGKLISVEGYKAFRGTMKIRPKTAAVPSFELFGDWLYKPETDCWYGKGSSFAADICTIMEVR